MVKNISEFINKAKYAFLCSALLAASLFTPVLAEDGNTLVIKAVASQQSVEVGDEFYVDFKVTENQAGLNNLTAYVSFDSDKVEALSCGDSDEPSDRLKYDKNGNTAIMFPYNFANSRLSVVPQSGDSDYNGKADSAKTAAQIGIIKYANFLNKSTDGYLDNYEGTGTLIRLKLKAVKDGNCSFDINVSGAQAYNKGVPTNLSVASEGTAVVIGSGETSGFTDIESNYWGAAYINKLADKGVVTGYSDGSFAPDSVVKRADFIIMLLKGLDIDISKTPDSNFTDVEESAYYYNAVGIAKAMGLANGNGDGTFSPSSNVTRQDMMLLAKRAIEYKSNTTLAAEDKTVLDSFGDKEDISAYAEDALAAMVERGYINGSNGKILPKSSTTRAQAAVVISKITEN